MGEKTFTFKISWHKVLTNYSPEIRLKVYDSIVEYVESGEMPEIDEPTKMAFLFIKNDIDEEIRKKNEISEKRREAAMRSVEKRRKQKGAKLAIAQFANKEEVDVLDPIFEDVDNQYNTNFNDQNTGSDIRDIEYTEIPFPKERKEKEIETEKERKEKKESNILYNILKEKKENKEKEKEKEKENKENDKRKHIKENSLVVKSLDLSFVRDDFKKCFCMWIEYKQSLPAKMRYNSELGIRRAYNHLFKISNGNPYIAQEIVDNSIAASYQGLFPVRKFQNKDPKSISARMLDGLKMDLEKWRNDEW